MKVFQDWYLYFGKFAEILFHHLALKDELRELFGKEGRHRLLLSNISWQGLERGSRILAGAFTGILLAAYLGPGPLGVYSYALSFVMLFAPIINLGYDTMLPRDILFEKEKWNEILGSSALLRFLGSLLAILFIWGFTWFSTSLDPEMKTMIRVLSMSFLFYPFDIFDVWFRVTLKSKNASISKIIALVLMSSLKLYLIWIKAPLISFGWLYVGEFVVNGILQFVFYLNTEPRKLNQWVATPTRITFVLKEAWPLLVSAFSFMVYNRIDQIMIGNMLNTKEVGIFAAAGKISDLPIAIILVFNSALYPYLANNFKKRPELFLRQYLLITEIYTVMSYMMLIVIIFGGNWIIGIYPHSFSAASIVLKINFIGLVFIFNAGLRNSYLSLTGNQKYLLYTTVASMILNILLNFMLIPLYGINGAAWASTLSECFALLLINGVFPKMRYIFWVQAKGFMPLTLLRGYNK